MQKEIIKQTVGLARNDVRDKTKMDPFIHTIILVKQVLFNFKSPPNIW